MTWLCFFFHSWEKWFQVKYSNALAQWRTCRRCGLNEQKIIVDLIPADHPKPLPPPPRPPVQLLPGGKKDEPWH